MKVSTLLLLALILGACASGPPPTPPPDWNFEYEPGPVTDAKPLPPLCPVPWPADDVQCWSQLDEFDIIAERNTDVAAANASALRNSDQAVAAFIEAGKLQQQLSNFYAEQYAAEKRAHWIDNAIAKTIAGLALIGLAL